MEKHRSLDVIDHLCRFCEIGRLAKKVMPSGKPGVWCTNCETEAEGGSEKLCWCGHTYSPRQRSHLYKCVRNETIMVENPHRVNVVLNTGEIKALREGKKCVVSDDTSADMFN